MDGKTLLEFLQKMGMDTSGLTPDNVGLRLKETIVVKKFDGDDQEGEPVETIVLESE